MIVHFPTDIARETSPDHVNPLQWHQSIGYARQACARIFRDGGTPADAMTAFGLKAAGGLDWAKVVDRIAQSLADGRQRQAA